MYSFLKNNFGLKVRLNKFFFERHELRQARIDAFHNKKIYNVTAPQKWTKK